MGCVVALHRFSILLLHCVLSTADLAQWQRVREKTRIELE